MNKDYTSKLGSKCREVLVPMLDKQCKSIHAIRRCLTTSCVRLLNRDVYACCNTRHGFTHENSHKGQWTRQVHGAY